MSVDFGSAIRKINATKDPKYPEGAYRFVMEALEFSVKRLDMPRHISGRELLDGIRDFAREELGVLARTVFDIWGITRTNDFGNIVFNLVEAGIMGKTENDSIHDFDDVYSFADAFPSELDSKQLFRGR